MNKLSLDVFFSSFFAFLAVAFNFWLIKEAELVFSAVLLSVFLLIRRIAPTFSNLSQLGCSQALIRFSSINKDDKEKVKIYFFISIMLWLLSVSVLCLVYLFFKDTISKLLLPEIKNANEYLYFTFIYIAVLHLSYLILPYFLNLRRILLYNIISVLNASVILLIVFYLIKDKGNLITILKTALYIMGVLQISCLVYIIFKLQLYKLPSKLAVKKEGSQFMLYGLPRSVMTFLDMFLLTIGSLLIKNDKEIVGSFLIAITLSRVILIVLQPLSLLSSIIVGHSKDDDKHKKTLNLMFGGILYSSVIVIILLYNWIETLISYWLTKPETIADVVIIFRILVFGLIPYCMFQGLKGIIEIRFFKPLNLFSLIIGLIVHVIAYFILNQFYSILIALSASLMFAFIVMGLMSLYWCRKEFNSLKYFKFTYLVLISVILFIINYYINKVYPDFIGLIVSTLITGIGFLGFVFLSKSEFTNDVFKTFKLRK
ncbi:hypothetical protein [uncultured Lacinutrix sp.]|uniref:hypothetical protein n=1 Tax=uncultured Lacinutrix sp. TaxID=574032 RepID=UPI0026282C1E|nr:hypothetical protein [uncultured Lacinutrix sp.]